MKRIKQIFDGEYGCEERTADEKAKVLVILENETGQESSLSVEDDWLRAQGLEEGSCVAGELAEVKRIWKKAGQYEKSAGHPVKNTESPADFLMMSSIQ